VGKLLQASKTAKSKDYFPFSPSPNDVVFDYTASGVRRSIEDSLQRLGIDSIDIAFVHDLSSDNKLLPTHWQEQFEIARKGAFPELTRMREEGLIKGWGIGVNTPEPILRLMEVADPDICLLASQYSLINHENALNQVFPAARARNVTFVMGSSLNAVASALVVGCRTEQQILADYTSIQTKIPTEFWADLKAQNLIEQNAPVPQEAPVSVG
jgi:D-threo-aldose 1-dehydrogenase